MKDVRECMLKNVGHQIFLALFESSLPEFLNNC